MLLVPASDYTIIDTWDVIGLAGTGSKESRSTTFRPRIPQPRRRTDPGRRQSGQRGQPGTCSTDCRRLACSRSASPASRSVSPTARSSISPTRPGIGFSAYTGKNLADFTNIQVHLAEACGAGRCGKRGDCSARLRRGNAEITEAGVVPSIEQRARYRRDGAFAASLCTKAVDLLFAATGGGAIYPAQPDPAGVPRRPRGQCPLSPELGRQQRDVTAG